MHGGEEMLVDASVMIGKVMKMQRNPKRKKEKEDGDVEDQNERVIEF